MAQYILQTPDTKISGYIDAIRTKTEQLTPYNFITDRHTGFFQSRVPFSFLFTKFEKNAEYPFCIRMLSPNFRMESRLTPEEFQKLVLPRPLHRHDTYEVMYIIDGELYQKIENSRHRYIKDSCCIINRSVRHSEEYDTDFYSVNISLSREYFQNMILEGDETVFAEEKHYPNTDLQTFIADEFKSEQHSPKKYIDFTPKPALAQAPHRIRDYLEEIEKMIANPQYGTSILIKAYLYNMLVFLNNKEYYRTEPMQIGTAAEDDLFSKVSYLMEQSDGRITRAELSEQLNYSGNYINQIVRKFTGMSIFDYGISITMKKAEHYLSSTDKTVSEIITDLNFSDRTHFYRLFEREFGMTPRQYRSRSTDE